MRVVLFGAVLLVLISLQLTSMRAQTAFNETGQIRVIVSETESEVPFWKETYHRLATQFAGHDRARHDYYFAYRSNGSEKLMTIRDGARYRTYANRDLRLSGELRANEIQNADVSEVSAEAAVPHPTTGTYKMVVVPLTIQATGATPMTVTADQIRSTLFDLPNSVNKFYREVSYGLFGFSGVNQVQSEIVPVTIAATIAPDCQTQIVNDFTAIVRQRLLEAGINTNDGSVDLGVIVFNDTQGCPPYPFATRGTLGVRGVPYWVWVPQSWFNAGPAIVGHEIGHALGGNHPLAMRCTNFADWSTCTIIDAPDRNMMTSAGRFQMAPSNFERRRWGWHPEEQLTTPSTGQLPFFDLRSSALPFGKDGVKQGRYLFRQLSGNFDSWDLYPETRRNWGLFENYRDPTNQAFARGVTLRIGTGDYMHPDALLVVTDPNQTPELDDAPLLGGQSMALGGVTTTVVLESNPRSGTRIKID